MKDNIEMHHKGLSREKAHTTWSTNRRLKTVPELRDRLFEILDMYKNAPVPDEPATTMPERKQQPIIGTLTDRVKCLNKEREDKIAEFTLACRKEWKARDDSGLANTRQNLQEHGRKKLDKSWEGDRIEYNSYYDLDSKGTERELRVVGGTILEVCDGTWLLPGARTRCYKNNEAARVLWDAVEEANLPECTSIEPFLERKYNTDGDGGWKREETIDYGF